MRQSYVNMRTDQFVNRIYTPRQCKPLAERKEEEGSKGNFIRFFFQKSLLDAFLFKSELAGEKC